MGKGEKEKQTGKNYHLITGYPRHLRVAPAPRIHSNTQRKLQQSRLNSYLFFSSNIITYLHLLYVLTEYCEVLNRVKTVTVCAKQIRVILLEP